MAIVAIDAAASRAPGCHLVAACTSPDTNNRHPGQTPPAWEAPWRFRGWSEAVGWFDVGKCWKMLGFLDVLAAKQTRCSLRDLTKTFKFLQKPLLSNKISQKYLIFRFGGLIQDLFRIFRCHCEDPSSITIVGSIPDGSRWFLTYVFVFHPQIV